MAFKRPYIAFLILWISLPFFGYGQEPAFELKAAIDSTEIKIGQQFHLILQATTSEENESGLRWAEVPESFNHLLVVERSGMDTTREAGKITFQEKYTLTGFDSGEYEIPAFQFYPSSETEDSSVLEGYKTNPLSITVHTVAVDTSKAIQPIKTIKNVPFHIWDYWPYLAGAAAVILILLYFLFFRKKGDRKRKEKLEPQDPPYEQAVKRLSSLEKEKIWKQGEIKPYYSELTDILKTYIHRQYHITALEQTTDELLENIKPVTRLNQQKNELSYILETADLAKFAKLSPSPEEHEKCLKKAKDFVEWTKPAPEADPKDKKE